MVISLHLIAWPDFGMRVLRCEPFFLRLRKKQLFINFQFSRKQKLKIKDRVVESLEPTAWAHRIITSCSPVPTVFLQFRKTKVKLRISIFNFQEIENKHQISVFNLQEKRKLKFDINFQFSVFNFHRKWKLKSDVNFPVSNFRLEQGVSISWLLLSVSRKKPGTNEDRKAMKPITVNIKALFGRFCYASLTPPPPLTDPPTALFLHSKLLPTWNTVKYTKH